MEEIEEKDFSLPTLLWVTGFCFLSFTLLIRILDGVIITFFMWFGLATFVSGSLSEAVILLTSKKNKTGKKKATL